MFTNGRFHGAIELAAPGFALNQTIPLFQMNPNPGDTTRDPKVLTAVCVQETRLPLLSAAPRWVVQSLRLEVDSIAGGTGFDRPSKGHGSWIALLAKYVQGGSADNFSI